ncbi:MAG TPA: diguanylate cyclase [Dehalococcoidia bacterium]|nr:diguanylate cyclase [Dehalococcoidia bacterium]
MTSPEFTVATVAGAIAWVLLLSASALAFMKARRAQGEMWRTTQEMARRAEQLRLLNRFTFVLTQETRRHGVARAATEFFVQEMGAGRAVFWRPDSEGEPEAPWLSFPGEDARGAPAALPEAQRIILARTAARGTMPLLLITDGQDQRPQPLHRAGDAPAQAFAVYIPLHGSPREGVMEMYSGPEPWGPERWELLGPLTTELTNALRRARHYEEVQERADVDFVTGLFNHRFMQAYLHKLVGAGASRGRKFAVLLMDVNDFKRFNDTYGHSVGDRVLQVVANQLRLMTDGEGMVGRFGGDEFIVVLPGHGQQEAGAFAQAFQDWLTNYAFKTPLGGAVPIVVSTGLAVFPDDGEQRQELLASADARLYQCKRSAVNGRNRSGHAKPQPGLGVFGFLDSLVTSIDSRDHYTRAHCESTAEYAVALAQEIGLSPSAQRTLRLASLLHDVGKICIPDHILHKRGALTTDEFEVIKHHVSIAEDLIVDVPDAEEVRMIARHHHERFDGSGYPDGLRGEEIPFLARILALADAFSAITLNRPYRRGLARDEAYAELQRVAGAQLDPELVKSFGRVVALENEPVSAAAAF